MVPGDHESLAWPTYAHSSAALSLTYCPIVPSETVRANALYLNYQSVDHTCLGAWSRLSSIGVGGGILVRLPRALEWGDKGGG